MTSFSNFVNLKAGQDIGKLTAQIQKFINEIFDDSTFGALVEVGGISNMITFARHASDRATELNTINDGLAEELLALKRRCGLIFKESEPSAAASSANLSMYNAMVKEAGAAAVGRVMGDDVSHRLDATPSNLEEVKTRDSGSSAIHRATRLITPSDNEYSSFRMYGTNGTVSLVDPKDIVEVDDMPPLEPDGDRYDGLTTDEIIAFCRSADTRQRPCDMYGSHCMRLVSKLRGDGVNSSALSQLITWSLTATGRWECSIILNNVLLAKHQANTRTESREEACRLALNLIGKVDVSVAKAIIEKRAAEERVFYTGQQDVTKLIRRDEAAKSAVFSTKDWTKHGMGGSAHPILIKLTAGGKLVFKGHYGDIHPTIGNLCCYTKVAPSPPNLYDTFVAYIGDICSYPCASKRHARLDMAKAFVTSE
jgi:hypothetical protein